MEQRFRWWVVGGVVALVLVGGALFSRYSASAAPGAPYGWGNGAWGPGMMGGNPQAYQAMTQMHNYMWGGTTNSEPDQIPQAPAQPGAKRIEVSVAIKEWRMDPAALTVPAGSRLVLTVRNDGSMPHHFEIAGLGLHLHNIAPGASQTIELNADKAGTYTYLCDIPGHAQLGQQGTLTITQAN